MRDALPPGSRREFLATVGWAAAGSALPPDRLAASIATMPLWIRAQDALAVSPLMTLAAHVGLSDHEALGEFLLPMVTATADTPAPDCWAEFRVVVPKRGRYWLWGRVRFPAGAGESFLVVSTISAAKPRELVLGAGPAGDDRRWRWANSGYLDLDAGPWSFRIRPHRAGASVFAPLYWRQADLTQTPRLNLFCLCDLPETVPTDRDARSSLGLASATTHDAHVLPARFLPVPEAGPVAGRKRVPDWMRCPRWFTKDSWRDELHYRRAGDIAAIVREVAANGGETLRLSVFWGGEAYFQSRVAPHAPGLGGLDYLQEARDEAVRTGLKVVAYLNPNALCFGHPLFDACVIRNADGTPSRRNAYGADWRPRAAYACINNPGYRRFLRELLSEIFTRYQANGLYVDGLTPHACFCEHCRARWRNLFDLAMPVDRLARMTSGWAVWGEFGSEPEPVGDVENDGDARRWTEMMRRTLVEATIDFHRTVKRAKPDAVTLFHSHPKTGSEDAYDGTLTEVYSPQPWVHIAWRSGELAGYSAAYRVPVLFNIYPHRHFTAAEARYHAFQGLAQGAYPNFWNAAGMKPVFDYMARCAEYLDFETAAPVKFLALPRDLHESETMRHAALAAGVSYAPRSRYLAPYVGAYSALMRSGLPVVTLHRPHFEEQLAGFDVLVLANVALMTEAQVQAVRRFVHDGGGLIATHETSLCDAAGKRRSDFALGDVFGVRYQGTLARAPRQVTWRKGHPLTAGTFAVGSLAHDEPLVKVTPNGADVAGSFTDGPPALLAYRYGRGRVVTMPGRFDSMQCYTPLQPVEQLFAGAVRWVAPRGMPVEVDAPGPVGVSVFRQPRRLVTHLVNHRRDSRLNSDACAPMKQVALRIRLPETVRPARVRCLWAGCDLPYRVAGATVHVTVGEIQEYEAIAVEW